MVRLEAFLKVGTQLIILEKGEDWLICGNN